MSNTEQLQAIIDDDVMVGEDLQMAPVAWTHRRFLLQRLAQYDAGIKELGELLGLDVAEGLDSLVVQVRERIVQAANTAQGVQTRGANGERLSIVDDSCVDLHSALVRELHHPFHGAAAELAASPTWTCDSGVVHRVGAPCTCFDLPSGWSTER